jgi:molybdopterin converting factor small subunit
VTVRLRLFAGLRKVLPPGPDPYPAEVADGATVAEVLDTFGVPRSKPRIIFVNGRHAGLDQILLDGDLLSVFPPVAGG